MPFLGTAVNFAGVLIFGILGALLKRGIPKRISDAIISAMSICVVYIGFDGALEAVPAVAEGGMLNQGLIKVIIMILSMGIGTLLGELVDIEDKVNRLGAFLEKKFSGIEGGAAKGSFSKGFVTCTLLFCVGAMAVTGSIEDGMGSPDTLLAKSVIDSIMCFVLASTLGIGCAFSAFGVLIYQGVIAVIGFFLEAILPMATVAYMSTVGSLVIIFVGTNMIGVTKVKTANMVPAIFMPIALVPLFELIL